MEICDINTKHFVLNVFLYSPFKKWKYIRMAWDFAELFNLEMAYSQQHFWIKVYLWNVFVTIGWYKSAKYDYNIESKRFLLTSQRKSNDEVLGRLGFVEKDSYPKE